MLLGASGPQAANGTLAAQLASRTVGVGDVGRVGAGLGRAAALAQAAAFTLLNPHVYLDTVLLVGSVGAQQPAALQGWFIAGAAQASLVWFALLGFGARWLAPWFARPRAWQVLDGLIGLTMLALALAPLAEEWDQLEPLRRQKWLGIIKRYASMKPDEQARVQEKMREWVQLTPAERRQARQN